MTRTFCDRCGKETTDEEFKAIERADGEFAVGGVFVKIKNKTKFINLYNNYRTLLNNIIKEFMKTR